MKEEIEKKFEQVFSALKSNKSSAVKDAAVTTAVLAKKGYTNERLFNCLTTLLTHTDEAVRQNVRAALVAYAEKKVVHSEALKKLINSFYFFRKEPSGGNVSIVDFKCSDITRAAGITCIDKYAEQGVYDPAAVNLLIEIIKNDKSPQNRALAVHALQKYADKKLLKDEEINDLRILAENEPFDEVRVPLKKLVGIY